jgi:hypothetical protein
MSKNENKDCVKKKNVNVLESIQTFVDTNIRLIQVTFFSKLISLFKKKASIYSLIPDLLCYCDKFLELEIED